MALSKTEIAHELSGRGLGGITLIKNVLDGLADLAAEQVAQGEDFTVPGVVNLRFNYRPAQKKGERFKKGDTYIGFGGVESTAEADSPARKASVKLTAKPAGQVAKHKPGSRPEAQALFLKSRAGKAVVRRKAR